MLNTLIGANLQLLRIQIFQLFSFSLNYSLYHSWHSRIIHYETMPTVKGPILIQSIKVLNVCGCFLLKISDLCTLFLSVE